MTDTDRIAALEKRVEQLEANQESLLRWIDMLSFQAMMAADAAAAIYKDGKDAPLFVSISHKMSRDISTQLAALIERYDGKIGNFDSVTND